MKIQRIQAYTLTRPYYSNNEQHTTRQTSAQLFHSNSISAVKSDLFICSNNKNCPSFTSSNILEKMMRNYLRIKSLNNSLTHSKRPYLTIEDDLKEIITPVKISVSKKESINAFDINPKNSRKYLLFLHGFSQNITSNQPLYKALKDSNFGILAIDYRGYGANKHSINTNERGLLQDMKSSIKYLKDKGIKEIGLIGHSFGGYLATKLSKATQVDFQILVSPMLSLEFWLKNVIKNPNKYKQENKMVKFIPGFKDQYRKIFNIDKQIEGNNTATYIIQAFKDRYIRTSKVNEFAKKINNLKEYKIIQQGGHRMDNNKIEAIIDILKNL